MHAVKQIHTTLIGSNTTYRAEDKEWVMVGSCRIVLVLAFDECEIRKHQAHAHIPLEFMNRKTIMHHYKSKTAHYKSKNYHYKNVRMDLPGFDPGTSRMLSAHSTN